MTLTVFKKPVKYHFKRCAPFCKGKPVFSGLEVIMKYKIVSDSACDLTQLGDAPFSVVPLHILVGDRDFADTEELDLEAMQEALESGEKSSTACPSPEDWIQAFGDAEYVYCVTITSGLSGSYNSARTAREIYEEEHPGRRVFLVDSLATGSKMVLLCEKLAELISQDMDPEEIAARIDSYNRSTILCFALASLDNFARNGRINPILARGIRVLGIRILGTADEEGKLKPLGRARGDRKSVPALVKMMEDMGYSGGRVVIGHNQNHEAALALKKQIIYRFGTKEGEIHRTRGLCSYYAEPGSVMVGFET